MRMVATDRACSEAVCAGTGMSFSRRLRRRVGARGAEASAVVADRWDSYSGGERGRGRGVNC